MRKDVKKHVAEPLAAGTAVFIAIQAVLWILSAFKLAPFLGSSATFWNENYHPTKQLH